jgi:hypothetical protein
LTLIFGVATRPFDGLSFVCLFGGLIGKQISVVVILDDDEILIEIFYKASIEWMISIAIENK